MNTIVIVETGFGNTRRIAEIVAETLQQAGKASVLTFDTALNPVPLDTDLLLLGAPTHIRQMPGKLSRGELVEAGKIPENATGLREWIEQSSPLPDIRVITFDTVVSGPALLTGSAAKSAARALKKAGWNNVTRGPSFRVAGKEGPLVDGEEDRARSWAISLFGD